MRKRYLALGCLLLVCLLGGWLVWELFGPTPKFAWSENPSISGDGRYVAFGSGASNLVPGDTNKRDDIFVHDRQTGETTRVSVASDGTELRGFSENPSISADGRYVAFVSMDTFVLRGSIFVHDRQTGQTTDLKRLSPEPYISADGRYVAFSGVGADIFVHDRQTGETPRVSVASDGAPGGHSDNPSISGDGRYVALESGAKNLVPGDANDTDDIFVHDRETGRTTRVSVASDGTQGDGHSSDPSISADGRYVAFQSWTPTWSDWMGNVYGPKDIYVHDRQTGQTTLVSVAGGGLQRDGVFNNPSISADGRYVAFQSWTPTWSDWMGNVYGPKDIYVHDRQTGETARVSVPFERPWWRKFF